MRGASMRSASRRTMAPWLLACPSGMARGLTGAARGTGEGRVRKGRAACRGFQRCDEALASSSLSAASPHQALQGVDAGQLDARVLDLDCRRRPVRGRSNRGVPLREKSVAADRETQRLYVTIANAEQISRSGKQTNCHNVTARDPWFSISDRWRPASRSLLCAQSR
jgi:hypothetical protein